jgi:hypothetical protein
MSHGMDRKMYPANWDKISSYVRFERAGNCCEWCGAENGKFTRAGRRVVLAVHHIGIDKPDGTPGDRNDKMDCRDGNLAALCQRCHLNADLDIRMRHAKRTRIEKKYQISAALALGQRSMFDEL